MINQIQSPRTRQSYFDECIEYAHQVLRQPKSVLETMFQNRDTRVIKCRKEKHMEIRLDAATIKCLLKDDDICDGSFLFFDTFDDLEGCIEHCTRVLTYDDNRLREWDLKDGCIYIVRNGDKSFLALLTE